MFRADIADLLSQANPRYAVQVVKHDFNPGEVLKMDGQVQTAYARKGWSSLMLFNMQHAGNRIRLNTGDFNTKPGLFYQQFAWLRDDEIGELDPAWNSLEGIQDTTDAKAVHLTRGTPDMIEVEPSVAREWWSYTTCKDFSLSVRTDGATA